MKKNFLNISLTYGLGFFLLRGLSFFLLPLYTNYLNTNDAGIVFILYTLLAFLAPIYSLGLDSALLKFFNLKEYSKEAVLTCSFSFLIISSSVLSLFLMLLSLYTFNFFQVEYNWLFFISIVLFFDSLSSRILVVLRLLERPLYYLSVGLINIVGSLGLNLLFLRYGSLGDIGALYALTLVSLLQFLFLSPILIKYINFKFFDFGLYKKMLSFGFPFFPAAILFVITGMIDRWFIKYFLTLSEVGLYGAGYKIGSLISIFVIAFNLNWQPYYLKNYKKSFFKNNVKKISQIFSVFLLVVCTCISLGWPLFFNFNLFGFHLVGPNFWGGGVVVPWVAFGYFFYGLFVLQAPAMYVCNKQLWSPIFWGLAAFINITFNYILIPSHGLVGAGIATFVSYLFMYLFILYKNKSWAPAYYINRSIVIYLLCSLFLLFLFNIFSGVGWLLFLLVLYLCCGCKIILVASRGFIND